MRTVKLPTVALLLLMVLLLMVPITVCAGVDQHGKTHELCGASYTVVDFAANWCEPCHQALPHLESLSDEYPQVRFLVVSVDEDVEGRDRLVADLGLRLPVIWDGDHRLIERFHPSRFPATYILDPDGQVVYEHEGVSDENWKELEDFLGSLPFP